MKGTTYFAIGFYIVVTVLLLVCANYIAGAVLFAAYRENPLQANLYTFYDAINHSVDNRTNMKIFGSAVIAFMVTVSVPFGLFMTFRPGKNNLFGNARFANKKDIEKEGLDAGKGVILGRFKDSILKLPGYEFVLLAAPTRTGKGVAFVVPNLLTFPESAVVLDIKGENYNLTSEFRRRHMKNEIYYFNPFSEKTHRWNPLSYVSKDPNFRVNDLINIATTIYPDNPKDPFWPDSARNVFLGLALLVLETPALPKTFGEILRQGSGKGQVVTDYLRNIIEARKATDMPLSASCVDALNRFLNNSESTLKSILASFIAPLMSFSNAVIDKATSADDFDLREVRKKKMTIYLHIPASEISQAGFILNLFFSQLITENVKELPESNPALKYQCLMVLDEFTAMGKVTMIAKGTGFIAGYNLRLLIIIQDRSQLNSVYGEDDATNIVRNMGAVIYFTPSEIKEAEEYSKMIGYNTVTSQSKQRSNPGKGSTNTSETESQASRALMLPQELLSLDKKKQLVVRSGIPVIMAEKIQYYSDPYFMERFNAVPMQNVMVGDQTRRVPVPRELPGSNWRVYKSAVLHSDYYVNDDLTDLMNSEYSAEITSLVEIVNQVDDDNAESNAIQDSACMKLARLKAEQFFERLNQEGYSPDSSSSDA